MALALTLASTWSPPPPPSPSAINQSFSSPNILLARMAPSLTGFPNNNPFPSLMNTNSNTCKDRHAVNPPPTPHWAERLAQAAETMASRTTPGSVTKSAQASAASSGRGGGAAHRRRS